MMLFKNLSPINRRRLDLFKSNRRGFWAFVVFSFLFLISLFAPMFANDKPIIGYYKGEFLFPQMKEYPDSMFGGFLAQAEFRDPLTEDEIKANGWLVWPPLRYSYSTVNREAPMPFPSRPAFLLSRQEACVKYPAKDQDPQCIWGNMNWLGTDDQGRDVIARALYGFRVSVIFGLILTIVSSVLGVSAGAVQGYFGGWTDLLFQRFIDIWSSLPVLYILLISRSLVPDEYAGFWLLLFILALFSWTGLVGVVRAEFLRARNFEYVRAAKALGLSNTKIMWKHVLPNALVSTMTYLPFLVSGSVGTLTALDYLGYGLPVGSASLGELVKQGKENLFAPWLGFTAFIVISMLLILLVFIGEAVRDALDPRKTFQ
jgi:microcin C transport system permease protein